MKKIVINSEFGGYGLHVSEEYEDFVMKFESEVDRDSEELVKFVEEYPNDCGDLKVVEIPNEATDWTIMEYDGAENLLYVLNGKIMWA